MNTPYMTASGLAALTRKSRRKVTEKLQALKPARVEKQATREIRYYWPHEALPCIYGVHDSPLDLTAERARLAKEQADEKEMANKVRRGELAEVAEIEKVTIAVIHATKARLLAIPSQLAPYLANRSAADCSSQLHDAIYEALAELSNPGDEHENT